LSQLLKSGRRLVSHRRYPCQTVEHHTD
jgi:hypothetical protein